MHEYMSQRQQDKYQEMKDVLTHAKDSVYLTCQNPLCGCARNIVVSPNSANASTVFPCMKCVWYTCYVCLAMLTYTEVEKHKEVCGEFADIKRDFDRAIVCGTAFKCPKCGIRGRKAYGCNYIHCDCGVIWCYLCEQKVPRNNAHDCTFHWTHKSCYMNLENLHRFKTCQLLHEVYLEHGKDKFCRMWNKYPSVRAHGYSLKDIEREPNESQCMEILKVVALLFVFVVIGKVVATYYQQHYDVG